MRIWNLHVPEKIRTSSFSAISPCIEARDDLITNRQGRVAMQCGTRKTTGLEVGRDVGVMATLLSPDVTYWSDLNYICGRSEERRVGKEC